MREDEFSSEEHSSASLRRCALARNSSAAAPARAPTWLRGRCRNIRGRASAARRSCGKVVVKVATKPGISITFALVLPTTKPWMASVLVPRKVTGMPAGTTMHCGSNEYCCAIRRTMTLPSASMRRAEVVLDELARDVQRARVDRLHPRRRHRRPVQPGEHHHRHQQRDDGHDDDGPAALRRVSDGFRFVRGVGTRRRHWTAPRGRKTKK